MKQLPPGCIILYNFISDLNYFNRILNSNIDDNNCCWYISCCWYVSRFYKVSSLDGQLRLMIVVITPFKICFKRNCVKILLGTIYYLVSKHAEIEKKNKSSQSKAKYLVICVFSSFHFLRVTKSCMVVWLQV